MDKVVWFVFIVILVLSWFSNTNTIDSFLSDFGHNNNKWFLNTGEVASPQFTYSKCVVNTRIIAKILVSLYLRVPFDPGVEPINQGHWKILFCSWIEQVEIGFTENTLFAPGAEQVEQKTPLLTREGSKLITLPKRLLIV